MLFDIGIQLAGDAQSIVAMTDDEKKRVEELLTDLDSLPEIPEENQNDTSEGVGVEVGGAEVSVVGDGGFWPNDDEQRRLQEIERRLKMLLPPPTTDQSEHVATPNSDTSTCRVSRG